MPQKRNRNIGSPIVVPGVSDKAVMRLRSPCTFPVKGNVGFEEGEGFKEGAGVLHTNPPWESQVVLHEQASP